MTKLLLVISFLALISSTFCVDPENVSSPYYSIVKRAVEDVHQEMINQANITEGLTLNEITNTLMHETRGLGKLILDFIRNLGTSMRNSYSTRVQRSVHKADELPHRVLRGVFDYFAPLIGGNADSEELNDEFQRLAEENGNKTGTDQTTEDTSSSESSSLLKLVKRSDDQVPTYVPPVSTTPYSYARSNSSIGDILPSSLNGLLPSSLSNLFSGVLSQASSSKGDKKTTTANPLSTVSSSVTEKPSTSSQSNDEIKHVNLPSLLGPQGLPGLPGLPGLSGVPGAVPGLTAFRTMLVVKVGTLLALLKAVFILSCLKSAGLLALLLSLVIPIYGKWKKAGVVLPVSADAPFTKSGYDAPETVEYVQNNIDNAYKKYQ